MKKIYLLLSILIISLGNTWAQTPGGLSWAEIFTNTDVPTSTPPSTAWGSVTYPYEISTAAELQKLADAVNGESSYSVRKNFKGYHFKLTGNKEK